MIDKRKYPRVNYPCPITVWREDGAAAVVMANTSNIGVGGICVYFDEAQGLRTKLEIKIDNFFEGRAFKCMGRVLRCQPDNSHKNERPKYYKLGIEFLEMDPNQQQYLTDFVERLIALESKKH